MAVRSTGIFTKKLDAGLVVPTNGREFLIGSPRRLLQSQRQIIALGAAPGSSYGRCPDAGSLKFPQTPFIVRFPSAWRGLSERRLFCQRSARSAALAHASEITGLPLLHLLLMLLLHAQSIPTMRIIYLDDWRRRHLGTGYGRKKPDRFGKRKNDRVGSE